MDFDRIDEVLSTAAIVGGLGFVAAPTAGYETIAERTGAAVVVAVVIGLPLAAFAVYVRGGESHYSGPWGPADLVFLLGAVPVLAAVVWATDTYDVTGVAYWLAVVVGLVASVAVGVVLRDATVGEWPPGSAVRRERERDESPGGR